MVLSEKVFEILRELVNGAIEKASIDEWYFECNNDTINDTSQSTQPETQSSSDVAAELGTIFGENSAAILKLPPDLLSVASCCTVCFFLILFYNFRG